jgi:hypothetical protein
MEVHIGLLILGLLFVVCIGLWSLFLAKKIKLLENRVIGHSDHMARLQDLVHTRTRPPRDSKHHRHRKGSGNGGAMRR